MKNRTKEERQVAAEIGRRIEYWRQQRGMTKAELFRRAGTDKGTYHKMLRGQIGEPSITTVQRYATAVSVPVEWLLFGHPETDPHLAAPPTPHPATPTPTLNMAKPLGLADVVRIILARRSHPEEWEVIRSLVLGLEPGKTEAPSPHAPAGSLEAGVTAAA